MKKRILSILLVLVMLLRQYRTEKSARYRQV